MGKNDKKLDVGVLVGEFQTPILLNGYSEPIDKFLETEHDKHLIVLGISFMKATRNHPLDFNARRTMILEKYPDLTEKDIVYLKDVNGDELWSRQLDELVATTCKNTNIDITYYGTEAEVVNRYHGIHKLVKLETTTNSNWREECKAVGRSGYDPMSWRMGVCYATEQHYPTAYATVDCAIFDDDTYQKIWLARKPKETYYRLVGGFTDPEKDNSHEDAARREAKEETHLDCVITQYLGSYKIDDPRYRNEQDKIITALFAMVRKGGNPKPDDDIAELKLVDINSFPYDSVMPEHRVIFARVKEYALLQWNKIRRLKEKEGKVDEDILKAFTEEEPQAINPESKENEKDPLSHLWGNKTEKPALGRKSSKEKKAK